MAPIHLDDIPEHDRETVHASQIDAGDCVYYLPSDQWVTIERVIKGTSGAYQLQQYEPGRWVFRHLSSNRAQVPGPVSPGNVLRRKRMSEQERQHIRNANVHEGYTYAQLKADKGVTEATLRAFGDLWADKYKPEGWPIDKAWEDYKTPGRNPGSMQPPSPIL